MAFKFLFFASVLAVVNSAAIPAVPVTYIANENDPFPQYTYSYGVNDVLTGDNKSQFETRSGDVVQGQYSLIEPDGTRRIVDYTADPINGFNAIVQKNEILEAAPIIAAPSPAVIAAREIAPVGPLGPLTYTAGAPIVARTALPAPIVGPASIPAPLAYSAPFVAGPAPVVARAALPAPVPGIPTSFAYPAKYIL